MDPKDQIQEDELLDEQEEIDEVAVEPTLKNVKPYVDSVNKAEDAGPKGKKRPGDKSNSEKAEKVDKGFVKDSYDMGEDINALVESEATLSEGFKEKAALIMETALKAKLSEEVAELEEAYNERLNEELEEIQENLVEKIDSFMNYIVESWMEENKLAVEMGLRTEIAENFMNGLKDLFTESYVEVPDSKIDLVDELSEEVAELKNELSEAINVLMEANEELKGYKREFIIMEMSDGLADTQIDKLVSLSENVDFNDEDSFRTSIATLKETYFGKKNKTEPMTFHEGATDEEETDQVELSDAMSAYVNALRKVK